MMDPGLSFKTSREGNTIKVDYTIVPNGAGTFDPSKTTVKADGKNIRYRLIRRGGLEVRAISQQLPEQGVLALDDVQNVGPITVTWVLNTAEGEKSFTETFNK